MGGRQNTTGEEAISRTNQGWYQLWCKNHCCLQPKTWQNISSLQDLWTCIKSCKAMVESAESSTRLGPGLRKPSLAEDSQTSFGPETSSKLLSAECNTLLMTYWRKQSQTYVGSILLKALKAKSAWVQHRLYMCCPSHSYQDTCCHIQGQLEFMDQCQG